ESLEREKMQMEEMKLQAEERKLQADRELEREKLQLERDRLARTYEDGDDRRRRETAEDGFRQDQLRLQTEKLDFAKQKEQKNEALAFRVKQYGDAIRNSVSKITDNSPIDFLPFIANVERLFDSLVVPPELRVSLITPYMSDRCMNLINRLQGEDATSYDFV